MLTLMRQPPMSDAIRVSPEPPDRAAMMRALAGLEQAWEACIPQPAIEDELTWGHAYAAIGLTAMRSTAKYGAGIVAVIPTGIYHEIKLLRAELRALDIAAERAS